MNAADAMAKVRQGERDGVMFPKGVQQMLGFIYSMDGEVYARMSWHARMIELKGDFASGNLREFDADRINFTGSSPLEVNAECALKRRQIADLLFGTLEFAAVLARYGRDEKEYKRIAINIMGEALRDRLSSGRMRAERSSAYCSDLIWSECCGAVRWGRYNVMTISRRHHVSQNMVSRDVADAKKVLASKLNIAQRRIYDALGGDGVLY